MTNFTLQVTIGRTTREVEFRPVPGAEHVAYAVEEMGLFCKGAGNKLWPERLMARRNNDGVYVLARSTVILNRNGYALVGFADTVQGHRSEHNSACNG